MGNKLTSRERAALINNGVIASGTPTVAGLPPAASCAGQRAYVTDATATTFASTVAGGGSNKVPVISDGANWKIG